MALKKSNFEIEKYALCIRNVFKKVWNFPYLGEWVVWKRAFSIEKTWSYSFKTDLFFI